MPLAGDIIEVGRIPGWLIDDQIEVVDSATFTTTETIIITLTVPLVNGRTYSIDAKVRMQSTSAGINEICLVRIREDNATGNELDRIPICIATTLTTFGYGGDLLARFTAVATGNKTFVVTGVRAAGAAGTQRMEASGASPNILAVRYESG